MKKEEILEKSKNENSYLDEMQRSELIKGFGVAGIVVVVLCVVFSVIKALQGKPFYEFGVILFGYMSASGLYSYIKTKKRQFLIQGIACGITGVIVFAGYFIA
jgi:hypothetical protein